MDFWMFIGYLSYLHPLAVRFQRRGFGVGEEFKRLSSHFQACVKAQTWTWNVMQWI